MERLINVTSPAYGRRLVREIQRLVACKKDVYSARTKWRNPSGGPVYIDNDWIESCRILENRIIEARFYVGEFIEVTIANGKKFFIPGNEWEKAFVDGYGRIIITSRRVNK
jgi:hypothetical protein